MATGRKTVVVGQVIDPVAWGNPLWDQSVQAFASAADRTAQFPAPLAGAVTWLADTAQLYVYTGTAWALVPQNNVAPAAVIVGVAYTGQPIRTRFVNSTVASNAQGDFGLMTAAEFAGGGVLHCSIYPRGNLDLIFAPSGVGGTLQVRVYNSSGAIVVNPALPISARIDYFGGPPSSVLRPGNEVDVS